VGEQAGALVEVLTVHKAKGLEYPVVMVADLLSNRPPAPEVIVRHATGEGWMRSGVFFTWPSPAPATTWSSLASRTSVRAASLVRRLGGVRLEPDFERLAACGSVRLVYRPVAGSLHLQAIRLLEPGALAEVARPGAAARRAAALTEARLRAAAASHPQAKRLAELLAGEEAAMMDERVIRSIAGLVHLLEEGEPRPARVFAAQVLGYMKALAPIRPRWNGW
jgi:hypothetical protein